MDREVVKKNVDSFKNVSLAGLPRSFSILVNEHNKLTVVDIRQLLGF